jgi:putative membrane protein
MTGANPLRSFAREAQINMTVIDQPEEIAMRRAFVSLVLVLPVAAFASDATPDSAFYKHAAQGGIAEVDLGTLAQQKSANPSVKDFGAMMVKDHSTANEKLKSVATAKNISLPTSASVAQMASKAKLEILSGHAFDKSYIKGMIKDHKEDIAMFEKEAQSGQDSEAKAYAAATLPTLRAHLKKIEAIASSAGVDKD